MNRLAEQVHMDRGEPADRQRARQTVSVVAARHGGGLLARIPRSLQLSVAMVTAAVSLAALVGGCGGESGEPNSTAIEAPATSGATVPETVVPATEQQAQGEITFESLDASLMDDPEALVEALMGDRVSQLYNSGATPENVSLAFAYPEGMTAYAQKLAAESIESFTDTFFPANWREVPSLAQWAETLAATNAWVLEAYFKTQPDPLFPQDEVAYRRWVVVTGVSGSHISGDSLSVTFDLHDEDNSELNRVGEELSGNQGINKDTFSPPNIFIIENGDVKVAGVIPGSSPSD
jgi:hypothetical protein